MPRKFLPIRRALSKADQEAFDRLFDRAKFHTRAEVYMARSWPMELILLSICLEHGKMIDEILGKIKEKKEWRLTFSLPKVDQNLFLPSQLSPGFRP